MIRSIFAPSRRDRSKAYKSRAFLDGKEVTHSCQYADTRTGVVRLLRLNSHGSPYVDPATGGAAKETRHGQVRITRRGQR